MPTADAGAASSGTASRCADRVSNQTQQLPLTLMTMNPVHQIPKQMPKDTQLEPIIRNCPSGGASHLFKHWRQLCGHFECLLGVQSYAMNASQPCILPRKPARHQLKP